MTTPVTAANVKSALGTGTGTTKYLREDGTWVVPPNTNTWTAMVGATASANGSVGYVNAVPPKDGYNTKYLRADGTWTVPPNNDTHYKATLTVGASNAVANAATTNGNTFLKTIENNAVSGYVKIVGAGKTTVTSDANGVITINSTDANTTYAAGTGLSLSGTTFSLATSGVTKGSVGPTANVTPAFGGTFAVPQVTVDEYGRVTGLTSRTVTVPANPNTDKYTDQLVSTQNKTYPLLIAATANATENISGKSVYFSSKLTANPSTGAIYFNGKPISLSSTNSAYLDVNGVELGGAHLRVWMNGYSRASTPTTVSSHIWGDMIFRDAASASLGGLWMGVYTGDDIPTIIGLRSYSADSDITAYSGIFVENNVTGVGSVRVNDAVATFRPSKKETTSLGSSTAAYKWKEIWTSASSINSSSDERLKNSIMPIDDSILDVWASVNWVKFKFNHASEKKGVDDARFHTGLVAQQVQRVFDANNLDITKYGLFLYDKWEAVPEQVDETGQIVAEAIPAGDEYGIRYTEALCIEAAYQRRRADRLEERLAAIEAKLGL